MDFVPPFTRWLKQQRRALGLTQAELARRINYATVTLRKIEEGRLKPSRELAMLMAAALEVPAAAREDFITFTRGLEVRHALRLLPASGSPIIDREAELPKLYALLLRSDVRLVTLLGPPGVGKTRLAIELGHRLADEFADGVCYVPLADVRHADDVAPAIAAMLGVLVASHQSAAQMLIHALQEAELLLILDNFEHMLNAAGGVAEMLAAAPDLTVLVTSRAPLDLTAEHRFEVNPLAVPALAEDDATSFSDCPSVQLFVQRAQSVKPSFTLTPSNTRPVAEICAHLEGLPLAIELAAGRTTMFAPRTLSSRLRAHAADVLAIKANAMRDAPSHHRTLRDTIAWSYKLLDAEAQRIFRCTGVFAGSFSLAAAEAVCNGLPMDAGDLIHSTVDDEDFLHHFENLLGHNLIQQITIDEDDDLRFRLLEPLREFAMEQLAVSGETSMVHERHAAYYSCLADAIFFGRPSREDEMWMRQMHDDRPNLQAALAWRMTCNGHIDQELLLSAVVNHAAWVGGLMWGAQMPKAGIEDWLNRIESTALTNELASTEARAKALHGLVERAIYEGDEDRVSRLESIFPQFYIDTGIPRLIALGWYCKAYLAQRHGNLTEGVACYEEARQIAHRNGLRDIEASALGAKGLLLISLGNDREAEACLKEAAAIYREIGLEWNVGEPLPGCLRLLAFIAQERGDDDESLALLNAARGMFARHGDKAGEMSSLILIGRACLKKGQPQAAQAALKQAAPLCLQWSRDWLALVLAQMAGAMLAQGKVEHAALLAGAASRHEEIMQRVPHPRLQLRDDYNRILGKVRSHMNNKTTQAAWDDGTRMRDDEAVALVIRL